VDFSKDIRSNRIAMVSFCLLCQSFQAEGIVRNYPAVVSPVIQVLLDRNVNILQMPCPESLYGGLEKGLGREPKSYKKYDTQQFRQHCRTFAEQTLLTARALVCHGFEIAAVLGVEFSPSCAVNYQYEGRTVHRKGIYFELLEQLFEAEGITTRFIGVNRRGTQPAVRELHELLEPQLSLRLG